MRQDYPLYVAWFSLLGEIIEKVEKFPRSVRFTLSDRIVNLGFDIMELIIEAIYRKEREDLLRRANLLMEKLRVFIRISWEKKFLSARQFELLSEKIDEAGRMVGGWIKANA